MLIVSMFGLAIAARAWGWRLSSNDMQVFLIPWFNALSVVGFRQLARPFSNYTPPYLYLLWLTTFTSTLLPKMSSIKSLSVLFDVANAVLVYRIVKFKYPQGMIPLLGAGIFILLPTVVLDSAWWGQSDAIYTFFLLASFYMILQERRLSALIYFGVALAFKLQAVFFGPFLLMLTLRRRIPWRYYMLVPAVYFGMMLPAILVGRPIMQVLTIYLDQAGTYDKLSKKAPNIYQFISNDYYRLVAIIGFVVAVLMMLGWAFLYSRRPRGLDKDTLMLSAVLSLVLVPFLLPKMHERYFYPSDVFCLLLALYMPRLWFVPLISLIVSLLTYSVYLFVDTHTYPMSAIVMLNTAAAINIVLISYMLWEQFCFTAEQEAYS